MADSIEMELQEISDEHLLMAFKISEFEQVIYALEKNISANQIEVINTFLHYAQTSLMNHFEEEEKGFFKIILNLPEGFLSQEMTRNIVEQLQREHALITMMVNQVLDITLRIGSPNFSPDWFKSMCRSLIHLLRSHAKKENTIAGLMAHAIEEPEMRDRFIEAFKHAHGRA